MHTVSQWLRLFVMVCAVLCASCLSMTLPQSARVDSSNPGSRSGAADSRLMGTWELTHLMNDRNEEKRPESGTRTLIEFKEPDRVVFSRIATEEESNKVNKREGSFTVRQNEIQIKDDGGNSDQWPYQITGDTLTVTMPAKRSKFYWKRTRP